MAPTQQRWPSNAELDLEARRKAANEESPEAGDVYAPFAVEGNDTSAYVGVSPEYMTYANDTEKPLRAEEGVEADLEAEALDGSSPLLESAQVVGESEPNNASPAGVTVQTTVSKEASGTTPGSDGPAKTPTTTATPTPPPPPAAPAGGESETTASNS